MRSFRQMGLTPDTMSEACQGEPRLHVINVVLPFPQRHLRKPPRDRDRTGDERNGKGACFKAAMTLRKTLQCTRA